MWWSGSHKLCFNLWNCFPLEQFSQSYWLQETLQTCSCLSFTQTNHSIFDTSILGIAAIVKYFIIPCLFLFCSILLEFFVVVSSPTGYLINLIFLNHCFLLDKIQTLYLPHDLAPSFSLHFSSSGTVLMHPFYFFLISMLLWHFTIIANFFIFF